jgi:hypothetical protein
VKHQSTFVFAFLGVVLAFSVPSRADSDGSFCVSKGYLAYDVREGITPGVVGHVLRVVRFGTERGIYLASEVPLMDFEVYHLICSEDRIEISGWRKVFTKYVIEFSASGEVTSFGPTEYPERRWSDAAKDGPAPGDLGIFGPHVAPLRLESVDPEHDYQLRRTLSGKEAKEGWQWHSKSELVKLDQKGTVLQRFALYERRTIEAGD